MAKWFGKDEEVVPELKDLTQAQIVERLRAGETLEAAHTTLKTRVAELEPQVGEVGTLKARIASLEANQKPPEPAPERRGPTSFLEDEDRAFNERAAPLAAAVLNVGAQVARSEFLGGLTGLDKQIYGKFGTEVDGIMKGEAPATRSNPQAWANAWKMVKGGHLEDITKAAQDKTDFFSEGSSGSSGAGPQPGSPQQGDEPTADEVKLAKKYGVDPKEFVKQRKEMTVYHG